MLNNKVGLVFGAFQAQMAMKLQGNQAMIHQGSDGHRAKDGQAAIIRLSKVLVERQLNQTIVDQITAVILVEVEECGQD